MDIFSKCNEFTTHKEYMEKGIYPYFHALETRQDVEVVMEGKRRIMLGSNNYLGLTACPDIIEAARKALDEYGTGCSGSRFLNGTLKMHIELEKELASFLHQEAAMTFPTGFQSNLGIISAVVAHGDVCICDKENHASIYDGTKLSYGRRAFYGHSDMDELEQVLKNIPDTAGKLIVTDGVFSMGGDICKLPEIVELAEKYGARIMIDDAHGLGVVGEGGRGTASYFGLEDKVDIYMGTFSKSLASLGGYMAAKQYVVDYVMHKSRPFIFSAAVTPVSCAVALASLRYIQAHPEIVKNLSDISQYARNGMLARGIKIRMSDTPIIPIFTHTAENTLRINKELFDAGVYVNPVLPPATAEDECLLRTSYMATHTKPIVDEALDIISSVLGKYNL